MLLNYLLKLSIFGDFSNINLNNTGQNDSYVKLVNEFVKKKLLIGVQQEVMFEINPANSAPPVQTIIRRPTAFSSNGDLSINFTGNRIDIQWIMKHKDSNITDKDFIGKAQSYLQDILDAYKISFNRIAINMEDILVEFSEDAAENIFKKMANPSLEFYKHNKIKEWNTRFTCVSTIEEISKDINIITTVKRAKRNFSWEKNVAVDCISVLYDINSAVPKNNKLDKLKITDSEKEILINKYMDYYQKIHKEIFDKN